MGGGADMGSDNLIHRMAMDDPIPWYKKPNLRAMYLLLFPCVIGIEMTSGFDSQIINAAQLLPAWKDCKHSPRKIHIPQSRISTNGEVQTLVTPPAPTAASSQQLSLSVPSSVSPSSPSSTTPLVEDGASCSGPASWSSAPSSKAFPSTVGTTTHHSPTSFSPPFSPFLPSPLPPSSTSNTKAKK